MNILRGMIAMIALLLLSAGMTAAEEIKVEGGAAAISTVFMPIKEAFEAATGDTLTIRLTDPAKAFIALQKGEVDMASVSPLTIDDSVQKAKAAGVIIDLKEFQQQVIAQDKVVVLLNKSNKVRKLSKDQLKGIFTGSITNWKEVGGEEMPIVVYWGKTPFLNMVFSKAILEGAKVVERAKVDADIFALREIVMSNQAAIVLSSNGLAMPKIKVPEVPLMPLPILAVTKGNPSPKVQKLLEFYKTEFGFLSEQ